MAKLFNLARHKKYIVSFTDNNFNTRGDDRELFEIKCTDNWCFKNKHNSNIRIWDDDIKKIFTRKENKEMYIERGIL